MKDVPKVVSKVELMAVWTAADWAALMAAWKVVLSGSLTADDSAVATEFVMAE